MTPLARTLNPSQLAGTVAAIPAKAEAHRMLIAAALAQEPTRLTGIPRSHLSEDIEATIQVLRNAGATIQTSDEDIMVIPFEDTVGSCRLDCGESGSTLRFILPVMAAHLDEKAAVSVTGHGRLPQRPLTDLLQAMRQHGSVTSAPALPFTLSGPLAPGDFTLPGNVSSQYITGLLLALPTLPGDSCIRLTTPLESASYIRITLEVLQRFGLRIHPGDGGWDIPGHQVFRSPGTIQVGGDWSNAALWLTAGAISGPLTVSGLDPASSQGDRAILSLLRQAGARVSVSETAVTVSPGTLKPLTVDLRDIPDLLPVLSILAAATAGTTLFLNAARLRLKESDRLAAVERLIADLGGTATTTEDTLAVTGTGSLAGGSVSVCHDHRLVMASALATTIARHPIVLDDAQAVNKSYPALWQDYHHLGGN